MNIKKENGSMAVFVLVGLLFMTAFLIVTFGNLLNKSKSVSEQYNIIRGIYSNGESSDSDAYQAAYTALRTKNKETITLELEQSKEDNTQKIELEKTYAGKLKNYKIYGKVKLPVEYQETEYIDSSGTQYINTGFFCTDNTTIDLTMQLKTNASDQKFLGSYGNGGICLGALNGKWRIGGESWSNNSSISITTEKTNIKAGGQTWVINGETAISEKIISQNSQAPIALFGVNYNGNIFWRNAIKVYDFKIYDDSRIKRIFIPCYRKADNVIGMYDTVNGIFYSNAGTGTFSKGNDIETGIGDLIENIQDANYGKYKIPIRVWKKEDDANRTEINKEEYFTDYEIIIDSPVLSDEYIEYSTKTVTRRDGTTENIVNIPEIPIYEDYTKIEILTTNVPSKVEIKYTGYTI